MAGEGGLSPTARRVAAEVAAALGDAPVVVALSGGADSAVLGWGVVASGHVARTVSIDHGLPGSRRLMQAASDVAEQLGLEHAIVAVTQPSSSETDLREARLSALDAACADEEIVVTGHTRDDLAETVLGNVLRGSGTAGLAGIPSRRGRFVRPMLDVSRAEAREVAGELGLPFADDPQNDDPTIRRNRLRAVTIPYLAEEYNPSLGDSLARLGRSAAADDDLLEHRAARVPMRNDDEGVRVPAASLQVLPEAVAARVARRALRLAAGPHAGEADDIAAILAAAHGRRSTIGGAIDVVREGPWVVLVTAVAPTPEPVELTPGSALEWGEWWFSATGSSPPVGRFSTIVSVSEPLTIRAPRPGERIALSEGSKRVTDALAEAGIAPRVRAGWPVLECGGTIVWIAGVRAAPTAEGRRMTVRAARRRS